MFENYTWIESSVASSFDLNYTNSGKFKLTNIKAFANSNPKRL